MTASITEEEEEGFA